MRESIGGTWILTLVIIFIVIFSGYLAISVNYSKAFKVKDAIISIIEKYEGHNSESRELIANYLSGSGYEVYGSCGNKGTGVIQNNTSSKYKYCVNKKSVSVSASNVSSSFYEVTVFFKLDLPVFGDIFTFAIPGETKPINYAKDY